MIDLAGSERAAQTQNTGRRMMEGMKGRGRITTGIGPPTDSHKKPTSRCRILWRFF